MSDFSDLLHEAEKLSNDVEGTNELPTVDRSLRQVLEASNELYSRVAQSGSKDIQANLLLGSKGIDLPRISQKLDALSSKRTFEPIEPPDDIDLDSLLENEVRNCLLSLIEGENKKSSDRIQEELWEHQMAEWEIEKKKLLYAMTAPSGAFIDVSKHKCMGVEPPPPGTHLLDKLEAMYAVKVMGYNMAATRASQKPNLVHVFAQVAEEYKDNKVIEMWEIMRYMTDLPPFPRSEDPINARYSKPIIKAMVDQAKKYLQDRYKTYMNNIISDNLVMAQRGGIPGTYPLVRSFVGIRLQGEYLGLEDGLIDDRPLWPMIYYCLRCGDVSAALYCLKKATMECSELIQILELKLNYPGNPEIMRLESSIRFTYRRCIRNATDPFKRIVWAVLGCCDVLDEHSEVAKTVDDYLWLKLNLVRVDYDKDDHIEYGDLQRTVLEEYGETHYDALNQPHLYFQVLALTGQFEVAIEFLVRIHRYRLHGVHIGIALHELYMLGGPSDYTCPLIFIDPADPKPSRRMNIARLVMLYVKKFEICCVDEAVHYFFLLNKLNNLDGVNVYSKCVSDLVQETKQYERLFGKMQKNNMRSKGLLDQLKTADIPVEKLAQQVGEELQDKALFEDAIDLYDLAQNQNQVVELMCILISQVVQLAPQDGSLRDRLALKLRNIAERYEREGYKNCDPNEVASFKHLKDLLNFFDYYHSKQYKLALKTLHEMQIIPFYQHEIDERRSNFRRLNGDVAKVMPGVLLASMNILFAQYQSIKGNEYIPNKYQDSNIDKQLQHIREQAKVLTNFTGMLPYRMPGDTNSRLVQMEILMH